MSIRIDGTNTAANPGITGADADTGLQFGTDEVNIVTGGTTRATVDSSGRLLVGTTSAFSIGVCQFKESVYLFRASSSTASGQNLGEISFGDSRPGEYARIAAQSDGTPGTGDYPGRLVFSTTADSASSPTERMRLDSSGNLKFNSGYGSVATAYGVRAWVNFNGQGPGSIRGNGNVSSFTKNANGDFTVNFTTAMPDANYCALVSGNQDTTTSDKPLNVPYNTAPSTSAVRIQNSGGVDYQYYMVAVIR